MSKFQWAEIIAAVALIATGIFAFGQLKGQLDAMSPSAIEAAKLEALDQIKSAAAEELKLLKPLGGSSNEQHPDLAKAAVKNEVAKLDLLPVGAVIPSMFPLDKELRDGRKIWAPADGSPVPPDSKYAKVISQQNWPDSARGHLPDLRNMFIRGLNSFNKEKPRTDSFAGDNGRFPGSTQEDSLESHSHRYIKTHSFAHRTGSPTMKFFDGGGGPTYTETDTTKSGGKETRPNNVALYYYIKIN